MPVSRHGRWTWHASRTGVTTGVEHIVPSPAPVEIIHAWARDRQAAATPVSHAREEIDAGVNSASASAALACRIYPVNDRFARRA